MRKPRHFVPVCGTAGLLLLGSALPAQAVDIVPLVGFRFGGDVGTQQIGTTGPTSVTLDPSVSYGGIVDIPLSEPRAIEIYYSRQPTKLSGNSAAPVSDVKVNVLQAGLVQTLTAEDQEFSWLMVGTVGATQLTADNGNGSATRASIGLGGGFIWMPTEHVGLRGDLRGLFTFSGAGGGSAGCGGGCSVTFHGSLVAQGELSLGIVARF